MWQFCLFPLPFLAELFCVASKAICNVIAQFSLSCFVWHSRGTFGCMCTWVFLPISVQICWYVVVHKGHLVFFGRNQNGKNSFNFTGIRLRHSTPLSKNELSVHDVGCVSLLLVYDWRAAPWMSSCCFSIRPFRGSCGLHARKCNWIFSRAYVKKSAVYLATPPPQFLFMISGQLVQFWGT